VKKLNLLNQKKLYRNNPERELGRDKYRESALKFGKEYFDGTREEGYGGYFYDGRWVKVAKKIISEWKLKNNDTVLDIGCAKGFLMYDLKKELQGLNVIGIDISNYAKSTADPLVKESIIIMDCSQKLPFSDNSITAVISINTLHNLTIENCKKAICEIERIAPGKGFIQVDAYRNENERKKFLEWMLTAKSFDTPEGWKKTFKECGYTGYYYWTILES